MLVEETSAGLPLSLEIVVSSQYMILFFSYIVDVGDTSVTVAGEPISRIRCFSRCPVATFLMRVCFRLGVKSTSAGEIRILPTRSTNYKNIIINL